MLSAFGKIRDTFFSEVMQVYGCDSSLIRWLGLKRTRLQRITLGCLRLALPSFEESSSLRKVAAVVGQEKVCDSIYCLCVCVCSFY